MPNMKSDLEKKYGLKKPGIKGSSKSPKQPASKKPKPRYSMKKPNPVSAPGTITTPYAKKPGMGKTTTTAIQNAARKKRAELAAKASQAKARTAASRVAQSGSVASAKAKGKRMGAAAPGVAKAAGVKPYALPKKRKPRPRMGAGVPGFTYGRDTM
jgi:hypothetical protein